MARVKRPKAKKAGGSGERSEPAAPAEPVSDPVGFMSEDDFVPIDRAPAPPGGAAPPTARAPVRVQLNGPKGELAAVESVELARAAMYWSQVVRNRLRWAGAKSSSQDLNLESRQQLNKLGVTDGQLEAIARADVLEVSIPYTREEEGWEARVFPWEYVVNAAIKLVREGPPLTVVRHLRRAAGAGPAAPATAPSALRLLYVQAVPHALDSWDFSREEDRVITSFADSADDATLVQYERVINPDREALRGAVARHKPDVIHVAGFDTHQAADLLGKPESRERRDGVILCRSPAPDEVDAETIAAILNAGAPGHPPRLVGFDTYNSASRVAALTVAGGAAAAVGFQDVFNDDLAELFFFNFYMAWRLSGYDALPAFLRAQEFLRTSGLALTGSGVVLWQSQSIVGSSADLTPSAAARRRRAKPAVGASAGTAALTVTGAPAGGGTPTSTRSGDALWDRMEEVKKKTIFGREAVKTSLRDIFLYEDVKPFIRLNYSRLHNDRGLFEKFVLKRSAGINGLIPGLKLRVEINVGEMSPASYEQTFDMVESLSPNFHELIRVPLVSEFLRKLRHTMKTNLYVSLTWGGDTVYDNTYGVDLLAVDEWLDTDTDRTLLPSFVLSGDPIVPRIIDAAQRYLVALRDDAAAGFDGYQALDESPDDPDQAVDSQVRAIWTALGQDFAVKYINPPPTFTKDSQRLRTPSDVVEGRRGTCIDLALLLMACLEYIDIHPVIFLLKDHAFPGYWRSPTAQRDFVRKRAVPAATAASPPAPPGTAPPPPAATEPWYFDASNYDEIQGLIRAGVLVPLETVWLTQNRGFWEAIEQGNNNLHDRTQFESMMDLWLARDHGVTPLPILAEGQS
jgi:hypothetical protein